MHPNTIYARLNPLNKVLGHWDSGVLATLAHKLRKGIWWSLFVVELTLNWPICSTLQWYIQKGLNVIHFCCLTMDIQEFDFYVRRLFGYVHDEWIHTYRMLIVTLACCYFFEFCRLLYIVRHCSAYAEASLTYLERGKSISTGYMNKISCSYYAVVNWTRI